MSYEELAKIIKTYLILKDDGIIKFICAVIVANQMPQLDPTFAFIVSSSSGGKSSLLESLKKCPWAFFIDDLTEKTFASGMKNSSKETSLLFRLSSQPGVVIIMSDFTLMLSKDEKVAGQIMSQLRLIYDGKFKKFFGTGTEVPWEGRVGFLSGVTTEVYERQSQYAALGERMLYYFMEQPDRKQITKEILKNLKHIKSGREVMSNAFKDFFASLKIPENLPEFNDEVIDNLTDLSELATRARSSVSRKKYSKDNPITQVNALEMPGRMAKQLTNLGHAMQVINQGELSPSDYNIIYKVALDSIPITRKMVMEKMTSVARQIDIYNLAGNISLPYETIKPVVEDLAALGIINKASGFGKGHYMYQMKEEYRVLMSKFQHIQIADTVLNKQDQNEAPIPVIESAQVEGINF